MGTIATIAIVGSSARSISGSASNGTKSSLRWWWTDYSEKYVNVYVRSTRVAQALGLGVHHYIACDGIDDRWRVVEWDRDGVHIYSTTGLRGKTCASIGKYKLGDVLRAAENSAYGSSYGTNFNCNHFTEKLVGKLGYDITLHWNCSCVL